MDDKSGERNKVFDVLLSRPAAVFPPTKSTVFPSAPLVFLPLCDGNRASQPSLLGFDITSIRISLYSPDKTVSLLLEDSAQPEKLTCYMVVCVCVCAY